MRTSQQCPKCQSRKLFVVDPVRLPVRELNDPGNPVQGTRVVPTTAAVTCGVVKTVIEAGRIEAWVCAECGYLEYYAKNASSSLWELAQKPAQTGVRYLDGSPDTGTPFR